MVTKQASDFKELSLKTKRVIENNTTNEKSLVEQYKEQFKTKASLYQAPKPSSLMLSKPKKINLQSNKNLYKMLIEKIFEQIEGESNIIFDRRNDVLKEIDPDGTESEVLVDSFCTFVNDRCIRHMPNYVNENHELLTIIEDEEVNGFMTPVEYNSLNNNQASVLMNNVITKHKARKNPLFFPEKDEFLEDWKKLVWDKKSRLFTPLWIVDPKDGEIGEEILKFALVKFVVEVILRASNKKYAHMDESLAIHSDLRGLGKTSLCREIFTEDLHCALRHAFTMNSTYDMYALLRKISVLEIPEAGPFRDKRTSFHSFKDLMTSDVLVARSPRSLNEKRSQRSFVIVETSNTKKMIPSECAGRSWLPFSIIGPNTSLEIKDPISGKIRNVECGEDTYYYIEQNREQLIAEAIHLIYEEGKTPEDLYPCFNRKYGVKLNEYQKPFLMKEEDQFTQDKVMLLNDALDGVGFDIRKYPVKMEAFSTLDKRFSGEVLEADKWKITRIRGKKQIRVWIHKNYALEHLSQSNQYDYVVTKQHIIEGKPKPLPNQDEDNSSSDGPSKPPNKPQPPTPNDSPQTTLGPSGEDSRAESESLKPLEKGDPNLPTLPESNLSNEEGLKLHESRDDRYIGYFMSEFDVEVKDLETKQKKHKLKVTMTPNLSDMGIYEELYPQMIDSDRIHYGAVKSDVIVGAQFIWGEWDNLSLPQQYELILRINNKIPVSHFFYTGNKSLQFYIALEELIYGLDLENEWKILMDGLAVWAGSDASLSNVNRAMAHPLGPNPHTGKMPICWKVNDKRATKDELSFLKKFVKPKKKNIIKYNPVRMNLGYKTQDEVKLDIKEGWNRLKPSIESAKDKYIYDQYRDLVFATSVLCQENNINLDWLIQLLQNHSPNRKKAFEIAVLTAKGDIGSGTFYRWFNEKKMPGEE